MSTGRLGSGGIPSDVTDVVAKSDFVGSRPPSGIQLEVQELPTYKVGKRKRASTLAIFFLTPPRWVLWIMRRLPFIPTLFRLPTIARYDHVAEALSRHDVFRVPFSSEMARLSHPPGREGTPFILGLDDEEKHNHELKILMAAFKRSDIADVVVPRSRSFAQERMKAASSVGHIDAVRELITGVPLHLCTMYFGVDIPGNRQDFADALIDISGHLFKRPPIKPSRAAVENRASEYVLTIIDRSIDNSHKHPESVLARLMTASARGELTRDDIRSFLIGMLTGFVPTNTIAGGHILETLFKRREFMAAACGAARSGDDDLLKRCLFEALRFKPHNLGAFRNCTRDYTIGAGKPHSRRIKAGTTVLVSTLAAMFDSDRVREPAGFNPYRPASDYLYFGYGLHWCVGAFLAQAQITQTFKALLLKNKLQAAGKMKLRGTFPDAFVVTFDPVKPS